MPQISARSFRQIWWFHIFYGTLAGAGSHTLVQFAASFSLRTLAPSELVFILIHWFLGATFGALVLIPAFTLQTLVAWALYRKRASPILHAATGAALQAFLVYSVTRVAPIEPSLKGHFPVTQPLIVAGAIVGGLVGGAAAGRMKTQRPRPEI